MSNFKKFKYPSIPTPCQGTGVLCFRGDDLVYLDAPGCSSNTSKVQQHPGPLFSSWALSITSYYTPPGCPIFASFSPATKLDSFPHPPPTCSSLSNFLPWLLPASGDRMNRPESWVCIILEFPLPTIAIFPGGSGGKEAACNAGDQALIPGKIPGRRKWRPTAAFLPGEFYGQRNLVGSSPGGPESRARLSD